MQNLSTLLPELQAHHMTPALRLVSVEGAQEQTGHIAGHYLCMQALPSAAEKRFNH